MQGCTHIRAAEAFKSPRPNCPNCCSGGNCLDLRLDRLLSGSEAAVEGGGAGGSGGGPPVLSLRGWSLDMLQAACVLAGCDFLPSLKGISFKTAAGFVARRRSLEGALRALRLEKRFQLAATDEYCAAARKASLAFKHCLGEAPWQGQVTAGCGGRPKSGGGAAAGTSLLVAVQRGRGREVEFESLLLSGWQQACCCACILRCRPTSALALLPLPAVFCANTSGGSCRRLTPLPTSSQQLQGRSGATAGSSGGSSGGVDLSHLGAELAPDVARSIAYGGWLTHCDDMTSQRVCASQTSGLRISMLLPVACIVHTCKRVYTVSLSPCLLACLCAGSAQATCIPTPYSPLPQPRTAAAEATRSKTPSNLYLFSSSNSNSSSGLALQAGASSLLGWAAARRRCQGGMGLGRSQVPRRLCLRRSKTVSRRCIGGQQTFQIWCRLMCSSRRQGVARCASSNTLKGAAGRARSTPLPGSSCLRRLALRWQQPCQLLVVHHRRRSLGSKAAAQLLVRSPLQERVEGASSRKKSR